MIRFALLALAACASSEVAPPPIAPAPPPPADAMIPDAAPADAAIAASPEVWLRGSTHVHARPSGDSTTPIPEVIAWYESRGYDFIFLTDHNKVSEVGDVSTEGTSLLRPIEPNKLIVLSGIELTHNPSDCIPPGDASRRCRIHVNLLGPTARPVGKVTWANRKTHDRLLKYDAALAQQKLLGGIAQINHPTWYWGMTHDVLAELGRRGFALVEIANSAFAAWNTGDKDHPSTDALWDAVLQQGVTLWGVASDDAHDYAGGGKYPAGGGWIVVRAQRDPAAILAAIAAGRFYASNGPVLDRAEVVGDELVIELGTDQRASIEWIENGVRVARDTGSAKRALPAQGYLRAVIVGADGTRAWVQPARRVPSVQ